MRVALHDIEESSKELTFEEPTGELNPLFEHGAVCDYRFSKPASVQLRCHRTGPELFFSGEAEGTAEGQCARCLEPFETEFATSFSFVYLPRDGGDLSQDSLDGELDVGFYDGYEVDLSPLLRERLLLSLPTLPVCKEDCLGLCANCGANLNQGPCGCPAEHGDPRLAVLRGLRVKG
jgi:uncharacterized protein